MNEKEKEDFLNFIKKAQKKTLELAKLLDINDFSFKESIYSCIVMACMDSMDVGFPKENLHDLLDEVHDYLSNNKNKFTLN